MNFAPCRFKEGGFPCTGEYELTPVVAFGTCAITWRKKMAGVRWSIMAVTTTRTKGRFCNSFDNHGAIRGREPPRFLVARRHEAQHHPTRLFARASRAFLRRSTPRGLSQTRRLGTIMWLSLARFQHEWVQSWLAAGRDV